MTDTKIASSVLDAPVEGLNLPGGTLRGALGVGPTVLVFLRNFGCIFCRETVTDLRSLAGHDPSYPAVLFVFQEGLEQGRVFFLKHWPEARAVSDPEKRLFAAFGLARGRWKQIVGLATWRARWRAFRKRNRRGRATGDVRLMPGVFLVTGGSVTWRHTYEHAGDGPDFRLIPRTSRSIEFFERQFQRQVLAQEYALNPFESLALEHLKGEMLDLGCGLGNLSLEAARRGCIVTAVDGSPTAVGRIRSAAARESLPVSAVRADLRGYSVAQDYDTIVAIGLLMFMREENALGLLHEIRERVRPGGRALVNVLVEGTTFLDMFEPGNYYLFGGGQLLEYFAGWKILLWRHDSFEAPGNTLKVFTTLVAERPSDPGFRP